MWDRRRRAARGRSLPLRRPTHCRPSSRRAARATPAATPAVLPTAHPTPLPCRRSYLCGRHIGLVLGGGGARGLAHVGVIRALGEQRYPVDWVGGTSQGACVGAMYAMTTDWRGVRELAQRLAAFMGDPFTLLADLTLPLLSFFSGEKMNELLQVRGVSESVQECACS